MKERFEEKTGPVWVIFNGMRKIKKEKSPLQVGCNGIELRMSRLLPPFDFGEHGVEERGRGEFMAVEKFVGDMSVNTFPFTFKIKARTIIIKFIKYNSAFNPMHITAPHQRVGYGRSGIKIYVQFFPVFFPRFGIVVITNTILRKIGDTT